MNIKNTLIAALGVMVIGTNTASAARFIDVNAETRYSSAIEWMAQNRVIEGYPDGTFGPNRCVNRVELLKMLFLANETTLDTTSASVPFSDIELGEWYGPYLRTAYLNGVVNGYPDGTFKPGQCVNRVEALKMTLEEFQIMDKPLPDMGRHGFTDIDQNSWYLKYFMHGLYFNLTPLLHKGVDHYNLEVDGEYGKLYFPADGMTRKEVAELLYRTKALQDNNASSYDTSITPHDLPSSTPTTTNYNNSKFGLSFTIPDGWTIASEEELEQGLSDSKQLRLKLIYRHDNTISMTINTPPIETGYIGYQYETGFPRTIEGLTLKSARLLRYVGFEDLGNYNLDDLEHLYDNLIAFNTYYKQESDWNSHIEFLFFSSESSNFHTYLPDFYKVLDSVKF